MDLIIVVAMAENRAIGLNNQLLWHLPADMKHFRAITTNGAVIMGRKTYESIGKPLPNRLNIVVSRDSSYWVDGCVIVNSLEEAIAEAKASKREAFIIGGAAIYALALPVATKIHLTEVKTILRGDTFFVELPQNEWREISRIAHKADEKNLYDYDFVELERI